MEKLKQTWLESNIDERETIVIAYWVVNGKKNIVTPGELTNRFLDKIFTKKEMVERVFTDCNSTRVNHSLETPVLAVLKNEDPFAMLGFEAYQNTMLRLVSENTMLFKRAVKVFKG